MKSTTDTPIQITGRLSFPQLFEPKAFDDTSDDKRYSCTIILDKKADAKDIKLIQERINLLLKTAPELKGITLPPERICMQDGSRKEDTDGYGAGVMSIAISKGKNKQTGILQPVPIVDRDGITPLTMQSNRPYAGCKVKVAFNLWVQDNKYGKRINGGLIAVQFVADGEPFGNGASQVKFDAVPEDDNET